MKNVKKVLVVFMATLFLSGIVAASAETFSFYIPEYGAASSSFIYKEMNVSKANVAVTSATIPGVITNFLIAQTGTGTQLTEAYAIGVGSAHTFAYSYNGNNYSLPRIEVALRGNYTSTGWGYSVVGNWYPNWS